MSLTKNSLKYSSKNKICFMTKKFRKMKDILLVVLLHSIMKSTEKAWNTVSILCKLQLTYKPHVHYLEI